MKKMAKVLTFLMCAALAFTFWGCENLKSIVLPASLERISEDGVFYYSMQQEILFTVPEGSYAEQYCRENELTCVSPDGKPLTGGAVPDEAAADRPVDGPMEEDAFVSEEPDGETYGGSEDGDKARYNEAMALYDEEKYYSAQQAFIESGYGDWEEMADKCVQDMPATGEIWRDRSQWLQDMELKIIVEQPQDTAMFVRIFKDNAPVSCLFINGSEPVTVRLPGNGYYEIRDGIGHTWYGIKEAFGREGRYETMTFDENGTEKVFLQSYYAYTLSINVSYRDDTADAVYSNDTDWESFAAE